jgi:hypothetical protein
MCSSVPSYHGLKVRYRVSWFVFGKYGWRCASSFSCWAVGFDIMGFRICNTMYLSHFLIDPPPMFFLSFRTLWVSQVDARFARRLTIVGDIHGQLDDLLTIFELNGAPRYFFIRFL